MRGFLLSQFILSNLKKAQVPTFSKSQCPYDMVVVCRRRETEPEKQHWSVLEDQIYFKVEDELKRLEKHKKIFFFRRCLCCDHWKNARGLFKTLS